MENISVFVRIKQTKEAESNFTIDSKTLTNNKTKEVFSFGTSLPLIQLIIINR